MASHTGHVSDVASTVLGHVALKCRSTSLVAPRITFYFFFPQVVFSELCLADISLVACMNYLKPFFPETEAWWTLPPTSQSPSINLAFPFLSPMSLCDLHAILHPLRDLD